MADLAQFVRARMGGIRACYENQLRQNQALRGRVRISFAIQENGAVADVAHVEDTVGEPELVKCIVALVRTWRTPFRPTTSVLVEYPLVFSAKNG